MRISSTSRTKIISGMRHFLQAPPCSSRQLLATGHPVSGIQTLKCKDFKIYRTSSGNSEMCEKKAQNDMVGYPHSPQTSQAWDAPQQEVKSFSEVHTRIIDLGPLCSRRCRSNEIYKSFLQPTIGLGCREEMVLSANECCSKYSNAIYIILYKVSI